MARFLKTFFFTLFLLIVLISFAMYIGWSYGKNPATYVNTDRASVLKEIKELQRLETAVYTFEKIIDASTTGGKLSQVLFGDRLLLIAHGQVIAGFDLSTMQENDIQIENQKITLTLPPPQILVSKLDNDQTRVYDRRTGVLTKGNQDLETQARAEAERSIRTAACDSDILITASDNMKKQLATLFKSLNYTEVIINIPAGSCQ